MALQGKVAVVTGSTNGIGLAIARKFAQEGCQIVLHGSRSVEDAQTILADFSQYGVDVIYVQASLTEPETGAKTIISQALEQFSRIDILG
jgi:3-hydroxybutyrate dehydrogenase